MTWNIYNLVLENYDFQWTEQPMPRTTEFDNTKPITKSSRILVRRVKQKYTRRCYESRKFIQWYWWTRVWTREIRDLLHLVSG